VLADLRRGDRGRDFFGCFGLGRTGTMSYTALLPFGYISDHAKQMRNQGDTPGQPGSTEVSASPGQRRVIADTPVQGLTKPGIAVMIGRGELVTWIRTTTRAESTVCISYRNDLWLMSTTAWETAAPTT
jgi:hypothetical protein